MTGLAGEWASPEGTAPASHPPRQRPGTLAAAAAGAGCYRCRCCCPLRLPLQMLPQDVVHLDAFGKRGELLYCLGHEVRSLHHPGYQRPLYNRRDY